MASREGEEGGWADETARVADDNLLWKQYAIYVDLFKFYVDITWKSSTWFYAITGAILTYYFGQIRTTLSYDTHLVCRSY